MVHGRFLRGRRDTPVRGDFRGNVRRRPAFQDAINRRRGTDGNPVEQIGRRRGRFFERPAERHGENRGQLVHIAFTNQVRLFQVRKQGQRRGTRDTAGNSGIREGRDGEIFVGRPREEARGGFGRDEGENPGEGRVNRNTDRGREHHQFRVFRRLRTRH